MRDMNSFQERSLKVTGAGDTLCADKLTVDPVWPSSVSLCAPYSYSFLDTQIACDTVDYLFFGILAEFMFASNVCYFSWGWCFEYNCFLFNIDWGIWPNLQQNLQTIAVDLNETVHIHYWRRHCHIFHSVAWEVWQSTSFLVGVYSTINITEVELW